MKPYGVFVTLNDTQRTGLLHVSNMSKVHVRSPEVEDLRFGRFDAVEVCRMCLSTER